MALSMTGRVADGLILQLADPDLIRWFVDQVREAAPGSRAGSRLDPHPGGGGRPSSARVELGRERTRWFPALVSNHVVDLVNKYPREQLPASLTGYIRDREGYDYLHHAEVGSSNAAFVGDDVTDRFCVLGTADEHVAKLRELAAAGVDQFNLYLMNGDEEEQLEAYGRDVIPAFALSSRRTSWPHRQAGQAVDPGGRCRQDSAVAPRARSIDRDEPPGGPMFGRLRTRDPWWDDGTGARKTHRRVRIESVIAFSIAIVACGVTVALWLRALAPLAGELGLS